jgi:hypothetical protein
MTASSSPGNIVTSRAQGAAVVERSCCPELGHCCRCCYVQVIRYSKHTDVESIAVNAFENTFVRRELCLLLQLALDVQAEIGSLL